MDKGLCKLGVGVLSGGLMFVGQAKAGVVASESFESSPSAIFGAFQSYAYSQAYTSPVIPPVAGNKYYAPGVGATITKSGIVGITGASGASASAIDAGQATFNLSAFFSSYAQDTRDWTELTVEFLDGSSNVLATKTVGGQAFVAALPASGPNQFGGLNAVDWAEDSAGGVVPSLARSARLTLNSGRLVGNFLDGYTDLVQLDVSAVPEPGSLAFGLGAVGILMSRRRRSR